MQVVAKAKFVDGLAQPHRVWVHLLIKGILDNNHFDITIGVDLILGVV